MWWTDSIILYNLCYLWKWNCLEKLVWNVEKGNWSYRSTLPFWDHRCGWAQLGSRTLKSGDTGVEESTPTRFPSVLDKGNGQHSALLSCKSAACAVCGSSCNRIGHYSPLFCTTNVSKACEWENSHLESPNLGINEFEEGHSLWTLQSSPCFQVLRRRGWLVGGFIAISCFLLGCLRWLICRCVIAFTARDKYREIKYDFEILA